MFSLSVVDHVRLNFERSSQNYTVHAQAAERLAVLTSRIRIAVLMLIGVATAAAMISLVEPGRPAQVATALAALLAFGAHASYLAVGLEGRVDAHRSCAHQLWLVCDRYRALLGEIEDGLLDRVSVLQRRDEISALVHAAYDRVFHLDQKAYETVRQPPEQFGRDPLASNDVREGVLPASPGPDRDTRAENEPVPH